MGLNLFWPVYFKNTAITKLSDQDQLVILVSIEWVACTDPEGAGDRRSEPTGKSQSYQASIQYWVVIGLQVIPGQWYAIEMAFRWGAYDGMLLVVQ